MNNFKDVWIMTVMEWQQGRAGNCQ